MIYEITAEQADKAYRVIMEGVVNDRVFDAVKDKQVEKACHTLMQDAVNKIGRVVEGGLEPTAFEDFLEAKQLCDSRIFTREYREKARELTEILNK
jgi:hypothetical protein